MNLLTGWRPYVIAAVVICALLVLFLAVNASYERDRFGDPAVLEQIRSSTDCEELKGWEDDFLTVDPDREASYNKAVGYSNAASDRMDEIGC